MLIKYQWKSESVSQSCLALCNSMDCSPPGSSAHGILQARILEWVVIPFSRGSSQPRDQTQVSQIAGRFFSIWATRDAPLSTRNSSKCSICIIAFNSNNPKRWILPFPYFHPDFTDAEIEAQTDLCTFIPCKDFQRLPLSTADLVQALCFIKYIHSGSVSSRWLCYCVKQWPQTQIMRSFSHLTSIYFELPCDENTVMKQTQALLSRDFQHERGDLEMNRKKTENYEQALNPLGSNSRVQTETGPSALPPQTPAAGLLSSRPLVWLTPWNRALLWPTSFHEHPGHRHHG